VTTSPPARTSKVPEITLLFWVLKIAATTLGETGGDAVTMSLDLGYLVGTAIFAVLFAACVAMQIAARRFRPWLYWFTIVTTTTVGTTLADFADRSLGIGYVGGSTLLFTLLVATLALWHRSEGTISVDTVDTPRVEVFYWTAILFSQTLGTALGDFLADTSGLGYGGGALVFIAALALIAAAWWFTDISRVFLFWAAFILTRPLGATVGDFLDKPRASGGLALDRFTASAVLAAFMVVCLLAFTQRAAARPHGSQA
jgi:uncharacterized membrane-anchored protein